MKKRIFSFFCACLLLFTALSSLGTFATEPESEEEPTVEELVELAKEAEWCGTSFWGGGGVSSVSFGKKQSGCSRIEMGERRRTDDRDL